MSETVNERNSADDFLRRALSKVNRKSPAKDRVLSLRSTFLTSFVGPLAEDEIWDMATEEVAEEFEDEEDEAEEFEDGDVESQSNAEELADLASIRAGTQEASPRIVEVPNPTGRIGEQDSQVTSKMNPLGSMGSHLLTSTSFTIETVRNRVVRGAIFAIYASVIAAIVCEEVFAFASPSEAFPFAILPAGYSDDDPVCIPKGNGSCEAAVPKILSAEAISLVNTAVVSDGLDIENWVGAGAKLGTPPFSSFTHGNVTLGDILVNSSVLAYDSNPRLHDVWDTITAVAWIGFKGTFESELGFFFQGILFNNTAGDWPASIKDEVLPVLIEGYACTHGQNCSDIGSWRRMIVDEVERLNTHDQYRSLTYAEGNEFFPTISHYRYTIGTEVIAALAWRILILGDPGGAVSACVQGKDCIATLIVGGESRYPAPGNIIFLILLVGYSLFLMGWAWRIYKQRGAFRTWACEQKWLLVSGTGFILIVNPIRVGVLNEFQPAFNEGLWAAAIILSQLGVCTISLAFACFCDAPRWYVSSSIGFYGFKILFCLALFAAYVIYTISHFPELIGYDGSGTTNQIGGLGHLTATQHWPSELKATMTAGVFMVLMLTLLSVLYYAASTFTSWRVLKTLPYGITRPMQLSFRFYVWATGLLVVIVFTRIITDACRVAAITNAYSNTKYDTLTSLEIFLLLLWHHLHIYRHIHGSILGNFPVLVPPSATRVSPA